MNFLLKTQGFNSEIYYVNSMGEEHERSLQALRKENSELRFALADLAAAAVSPVTRDAAAVANLPAPQITILYGKKIRRRLSQSLSQSLSQPFPAFPRPFPEFF